MVNSRIMVLTFILTYYFLVELKIHLKQMLLCSVSQKLCISHLTYRGCV